MIRVANDRFLLIAWPSDHEEELSDHARDIQSMLDHAQVGGAKVISLLPEAIEALIEAHAQELELP